MKFSWFLSFVVNAAWNFADTYFMLIGVGEKEGIASGDIFFSLEDRTPEGGVVFF